MKTNSFRLGIEDRLSSRMRMFLEKSPVLWLVLPLLILALLTLWTLQGRSTSTETTQTLSKPSGHTHPNNAIATVQRRPLIDFQKIGQTEDLPPSQECASCPATEPNSGAETPGDAANSMRRSRQACEKLLRQAAAEGNPNPSITHLDGCRGKSPLHVVIEPGHVISLLAAGADPNVQDSLGNTPLHEAARRRKDPEIVGLLLNAGADVDSRNRLGNTALQWMRGTLDRNQLQYSHYLMNLEGLSWRRGVSIDEILESMPSSRRAALAQLKIRAKWGSEIEQMLANEGQNYQPKKGVRP